jgi:hypothetical protein
MTLPGHFDGFVQISQIADTGAPQDDEPSKDRDALMEPMVPLT